jgi:thiamine-phosphate pyrophosphorylase
MPPPGRGKNDKRPFTLCLVLEPQDLEKAELASLAAKVLAGGVDAIQLRARQWGGKALYELARALTPILAGRARLIINDRADVALALKDAGVHLPASGLPVAAVRQLVGPSRLVGVSVHEIQEAAEAKASGADYVIFGPVYETDSKRKYGPPQGVERLAAAAASVSIPVYAIGGITPGRTAAVKAAGGAGVAVMSFLTRHPDPEEAARALREAWEQ